jgi:hypothetical protein
VNHLKYWRSNWSVMASSFILALSGVLVAGTIARAGTNAFACQQQCGTGGYGGYTTGYQGSSYGNYGDYNGYGGYGNDYNYGNYGNTASYQGGYSQGSLCNSGYYPAGSCGVSGLYDGTEPNLGNYNGPPGGYNNPDNNGDYTPQPSPTQPVPQPSPSESPAPAPINNNENNNSANNSSTNIATASVVVNPASTVRNAAPAPSASLVLPETGPTDNAVKFVGIGGLVAASVAYAASRRELLRTVFRK